MSATDLLSGFLSPLSSASPPALNPNRDPTQGGTTATRFAAYSGDSHAEATGLLTDIAFSGHLKSQAMTGEDGDLGEEGRPPYLHVRSPKFVPAPSAQGCAIV